MQTIENMQSIENINILIDELIAHAADREQFGKLLYQCVVTCIARNDAMKKEKRKGVKKADAGEKKKRVKKVVVAEEKKDVTEVAVEEVFAEEQKDVAEEEETAVAAVEKKKRKKRVAKEVADDGEGEEEVVGGKKRGPSEYHKFRKIVSEVGFNAAACLKVWSKCKKSDTISQDLADNNKALCLQLYEEFCDSKDRTIFLVPFDLRPDQHYNTVKRKYAVSKK
jgi:hypothetical protein